MEQEDKTHHFGRSQDQYDKSDFTGVLPPVLRPLQAADANMTSLKGLYSATVGENGIVRLGPTTPGMISPGALGIKTHFTLKKHMMVLVETSEVKLLVTIRPILLPFVQSDIHVFMGNTFQDSKVYSAFSSSCFLTAMKTNDREHNTLSPCRATEASTHTHKKKPLIKNHLHYWKADYISFHLISQGASGSSKAKCQAKTLPLLPQADLSVVMAFPICSQLLFSPLWFPSVKRNQADLPAQDPQRWDQCLEGNPWL